MITEDYVSFDTAKLMQEKGFNWSTDKQFNLDKIVSEYNITDRSRYPERYLDAPTLQMATKWLRKNFNMNPVPYATSIGWYFEVFDLTQRDVTGCALLYQVGIPSKEKTFETCEEACEAGIRYCLENLI